MIFPIEPGIEPVIEEKTNLSSADLPILIVEDNKVNQKVMMKLLEKIGYKSLIANHGKEALEILEKEADIVDINGFTNAGDGWFYVYRENSQARGSTKKHTYHCRHRESDGC